MRLHVSEQPGIVVIPGRPRRRALPCYIAGRNDEARHAYGRALELAQTDAERRSLKDRLIQLSSG
jgi:predicted RNA polymerase sigma factor